MNLRWSSSPFSSSSTAGETGVSRPPDCLEIFMILGKVVGTIVTTISHPHYKNRRLLVVQPLIMDGDTVAPEDDFIALDNTQAGIGDTVLVNREGNGARQALKIPDGAVISVIVGIVDSVQVEY
jgi:ethanolamine utilization protein EutN